MPAKGTVKDPETGRFVKADNPAKDERDLEIERLRAELAAAKGPEVVTPLDLEIAAEGAGEPVEPEREPLRLQSKYTGHTISFKPTIRRVHADLGIVEPVIGIFAMFTGPQRLFDSNVEAEKWSWSDEVRDMVERKLVEKKEFMIDYFPAPLSKIPDRLKQYVRVHVPDKPRTCSAFGYLDGKLIQCSALTTAGRDWCPEHDPDVTKIVKSGGTTVG